MKSRVGALAALVIGAALTLARAEDIKTVTGKEYKNVKISRAEPDGLVIIASYGIIKIPFAELPRDLQQKYRYDPVASAQFRKGLDDAAASRAQQIAEMEKQRKLSQSDVAVASSTASVDDPQLPQGPQVVPAQAAAIRPTMQETSALSRSAYAKTARAEQIFFDYVSNAIAADARYKDQRYSLAGIIDSISSKNGVGIVEINVPFYGTNRAFWENYAFGARIHPSLLHACVLPRSIRFGSLPCGRRNWFQRQHRRLPRAHSHRKRLLLA
jgi:hypothetical protein